MIDSTLCIDDIESISSPQPAQDNHKSVETYRLRTTPVGQLTDTDLRILLGQRHALEIVVPLSIDLLEQNPLAEAQLYKGALFDKLLEISPEFWKSHPEENNRLIDLKDELQMAVDTIQEDLLPQLENFERL